MPLKKEDEPYSIILAHDVLKKCLKSQFFFSWTDCSVKALDSIFFANNHYTIRTYRFLSVYIYIYILYIYIYIYIYICVCVCVCVYGIKKQFLFFSFIT